MKRKYSSIILVILLLFMMSACQNETDSGEKNVPAASAPVAEPGKKTEQTAESNEETRGVQTQMQTMMIEVGGQSLQATLYDNETVEALQKMFPMTLSMDELHGNEKFYYLDEGLPTNSENIDSIQTGDIMVFGSNCLVLFFDDFNTSYSYTRIGHIEDEDAFANAITGGTVEVTFLAEE